MKIGDSVLVIDSNPPSVGVIVDIKTWSDVIGYPRYRYGSASGRACLG